jgi:hypothetical protein
MHRTLLGSLSIATGLFSLVGIPFVSLSLVGGGIASGEWPVILLTTGLSAAVVVILVAFSIPNLAAGIGLLCCKPWSRRVVVIARIVNLLNLPFGPLLAGYGLWTVVQKE